MVDSDAVSHISSENGDVDPVCIRKMRDSLMDGSLDMSRVLVWLAAATPFEDEHSRATEIDGKALDPQKITVPENDSQAANEAQTAEVGEGRRELMRAGELPVGVARPLVDARVEVEFSDFVYTGTVSGTRTAHCWLAFALAKCLVMCFELF